MPLTVVGVGADGLSAQASEVVRGADVILGSARQLALLPDAGTRKITWPSPMLPALPGLMEEHRGREVCVLASGDPMFHGIGATLVRLLGAENVTVLPHLSSLSLACARLGWPVEDVEVVSAVGRPVETLHPVVQPGRRILLLSADGRTPAAAARLLVDRGYGPSEVAVLERLGTEKERIVRATAEKWTDDADALNVVAITCVPAPEAALLPRTPGLPDDAYESDGQLTKRELRAITLARLAPVPGQLLWDVGAGAGSIGIEWMRHHRTCRAIAVERDAERVARIGRNAANLGVPALTIVSAEAPDALAGLEKPDAIFVGGGVTVAGMVETCWDALKPGGRLFVNAVTIESETLVTAWQGRIGGELVRVEISRAGALGGFTAWRPMLPVTQWIVTKEATP
ncbi:precorrin-6y C5,15-methyltransferase (decarboxylating) subunit CbiE [Fodinicola acaciae]|uniref:precorrin-6y C5,15-methyltransferase (decarboxylating) subunit CbiE n=1 Tax=Fodinicola acaciae TaxID=2681555 RepID=UPI0013D73781|nr:precorrin-6y C5,15-methyltransferase (decarboxylating) subunit CbiE [Fodinicola acaciae]